MKQKKRRGSVYALFLKRGFMTGLIAFSILTGGIPNIFAQKGLHIESILNDPKHITDWRSSVIQVKGKKMKPYNQRFFHCLILSNHYRHAEAMENAVLCDMPSAKNSDFIKLDNKNMTCFLEFPPNNESKGLKRFIIFQRKNTEAVLIYMEGNAKLEKLIKTYGTVNLMRRETLALLVPRRNKNEK